MDFALLFLYFTYSYININLTFVYLYIKFFCSFLIQTNAVLKIYYSSLLSLKEMLGGTSIVPGLKRSAVEIQFSSSTNIQRTNQEKQMEIVEYLKGLPRDKLV